MKCGASLCFDCHSLGVPLTSVERRAEVPLTPLTALVLGAMIIGKKLSHATREGDRVSRRCRYGFEEGVREKENLEKHANQ